MRQLSSMIFDNQRNMIKTYREKGKTWEEIYYGKGKDEKDLEKFIADMNDMLCSDITVDEWKAIVELERQNEEERLNVSISERNSIISNDDDINDIVIPVRKNTNWQCYKRYLLEEQNFARKDVDSIEESTVKILERLNGNTKGDPKKGLVIGNVQSGKTANMSALMSMAADYGWNMFIVFSGTIENLRKQTLSRMVKDLNHNDCNLNWVGITNPSKKCEIHEKAQSLKFGSNERVRYLTVVLKNRKRIEDLIKWLHDDPKTTEQMKVLIIDDEADQASINTNSDEKERTRINNLLVNLVNNRDAEGESTKGQFLAMNYIGYTATPYANVLNEAWEESLYPRDFISTLQVPKIYFGPQQIFGDRESGDYDGLNIVRNVSNHDLKHIKEVHKGNLGIPKSLEDSIIWFICCAACFRFWKIKKPVSMLIHTSLKQIEHDSIYKSIYLWFKNTSSKKIIDKCSILWEIETKEFTKEDLFKDYPNFAMKMEEVKDYPKFDEIKPYIQELINNISSIKLSEDEAPNYCKGIHLCVDNCSNNKVYEDGTFLRIMYPTKEDKLEYSTAFIVIGGNTLSRGLTLEGLTSTFFLRSTTQGDTLMQMGRWFGYRRGYELLQRVWMTDKARMQFEFLSDLDSELRKNIYAMERFNQKPKEYAVALKNSPAANFLRITAKNRMQGATKANLNYSGLNTQTQLFIEENNVLLNNYNVAEKFINSLGKPEENLGPKSKGKEVWLGIPFNKIYDELLDKMIFHDKLFAFREKEALKKWVESVTNNGELGKWNVILFGNIKGEKIAFGDVKINKVNRTRACERDDNTIDIKILRDPTEKIVDVKYNDLGEKEKELYNNYKTEYASMIRNNAGLGKTPSIVIYVVNKDSKSNKTNRYDLNTKTDLIGISINVPGDRVNNKYAETVQIDLNKFGNLCDLEDIE